MKKLVLIDVNAIVHRAYHALPPFSAPDGSAVGAVYGFTTILLRILKDLRPDFIAAAFDLSTPTFRHKAYKEYKAHRPTTPDDLASQFPKVRLLLDAFGIARFEKEGYEADDIIGTLAEKLSKKGDLEIVVVTGDADELQLVSDRVKVYTMRKGVSDMVLFGPKEVKERYGLSPKQLVDLRGLKGDPSDNIPGVKGIGEKTATYLLQEFGSIEAIYDALDKENKKIKPIIAKKLLQGKNDAYMSRQLAAIKKDVPIEFDLKDMVWKKEFTPQLQEVLKGFGFKSILRRINNVELQNKCDSEEIKPSAGMQSLFAATPKISGQNREFSMLEDDSKYLEYLVGKSLQMEIGVLLIDNHIFLIPKAGNKILRLSREFILKNKYIKGFFVKAKGLLTFDAKAIIHYLERLGIRGINLSYDLLLAGYTAGMYTRSYSYIQLVGQEFGTESFEEALLHFFDLCELVNQRLKEGRLGFVFSNIEMPLVEVLADMERNGLLLDLPFLNDLNQKISKEIDTLTNKIYKYSGQGFNINSPQQIADILFNKLKLSPKGLKRTPKSRDISTSAAELDKLRELHPIVPLLLRYRELTKIKNTYIDGLSKLVNPSSGRVHPTFNQASTSTGRLSCSDPNLQNIPIMSKYGREIRKAFIAPSGYLLVSFDYSQIELRIAAHLAEDEKMIKAFREGMDIHSITAAQIYNISVKEVDPELRRLAKALNFGVLYGMGPQGFSQTAGVPFTEAKRFIDKYFQDFSGIAEYIQKIKKYVAQTGYVETMFGRRRYIPEINSNNWQMRREAERMAINMPIQGTAADIVKIAMIKVHRWLQKKKIKDVVRMVLQVHDELVFEIKQDIFSDVFGEIKKVMESSTKLSVPLIVEVKKGKNWGEQKKIIIN